MNLSSIKSKLLIGGTALILLPLLITGYFSYSKSHDALVDLSMQTAHGVAQDLARLTDKIISSDLHLASSIASEAAVVNIAKAVKAQGKDNVTSEISIVFNDLKHQFNKLDKHYQGIFIAGMDGILFTGILDTGKEYKGSNISKRDYFIKAMQSKKTVLSEVVNSKSTGKNIVVACAPILTDDNELLGALGVVIRVEYFAELISGRKIGKTGYGYMLNSKGIVIAHPNKDFLLKLDVTKIDAMKSINTRMLAGETGVERYTFKGTDKLAGFAPVAFNGWSIGATQNEEEFLVSSKKIQTFTLIFIFIVAAVGIAIIYFMTQSIVNPINATIDGLKDISKGEGDLTKRLEVKTRDELGTLSAVFNSFIDKLQNMIKDITDGVTTLSASSTELSTISRQMSETSDQTSEKANTVSVASEEMSTNMNSVAAAMEQSSTNTNMVASAAEQMHATINEIASNTETARTISDDAVSKVNESTQKIESLSNAAKSIEKVVETITDISEQVNLLSLNATIEAARAGEAGKGFAVVANEIKELAKQTSDASLGIKEKIDNIQSSSSETMAGIESINTVISSVNEIVSTIATAVEEQSVTTKEITQNITQAADGIQEVNQNVVQSASVADDITKDISAVSQTSTDMAQRSEQVKLSAEELSNLAEQLNKLVGQFKI